MTQVKQVELLIAARVKLSSASLVVLPKGYNPNDTDKVQSFAFTGSGIKPLVDVAINNPAIFNKATVADKVVGRAAALIFAYLKVAHVYAETLSEGAQQVLTENKIINAYKTLTPIIQNKDKTAPCPMESLVSAIKTPEAAYQTIAQKLGYTV